MTDKTAREILVRRHCSLVNELDKTACAQACVACGVEADDDIAALEAGGFAVVPKEPSHAMCKAGADEMRGQWTGGRTSPPYGQELVFVWSAMLAASNPKEEGK